MVTTLLGPTAPWVSGGVEKLLSSSPKKLMEFEGDGNWAAAKGKAGYTTGQSTVPLVGQSLPGGSGLYGAFVVASTGLGAKTRLMLQTRIHASSSKKVPT